MNRSTESSYAEQSAIAEDRAVNLLAKFPWPIAHGILLRVELSLAHKWKQEQDELLRSPGPCYGIQIFDKDFQELQRALANVPPTGRPTVDEEKQLIALFAALPSDDAWWTAHRTAKWTAFKARR
ncbi:hypothetical protein [Bradyrhizobium sp. Ash2021]|uniref:hypothetical protein n=1 Tax=Bradyrhizobium sp. Ash2021 TaxID=2954771 RepID=UPI0028164EF9|nr:hypothetical protein [Bradyrhizobium sp. Ash2021]WMT75942.1 hypothetical protein NL528_05965 [Bradyrhizobium sp. Ash2021]